MLHTHRHMLYIVYIAVIFVTHETKCYNSALSAAVGNVTIKETLSDLGKVWHSHRLTIMSNLKPNGQTISKIHVMNLSTICFVNWCGE